MSIENEYRLDSFRSDFFYISKEKSIEDLVYHYRDKLMTDENFFYSQRIFLREDSIKRIFVDKGVVWQDDYYELEDLYSEKLQSNADVLEHEFKDLYGIDVKYEEDVDLLSLKYSDKRFLPNKFLNENLQSFVKDRR